MKKTALLLLLLTSFLGATAQTHYHPKYDSIGLGRTDGTSGLSFFGRPYFKNVNAGMIRINTANRLVSTTIKDEAQSIYSPSLNGYYWTKSIDSTTNYKRDGAKLGVLGDYLFLFGGWHPDSIPETDNEVYRFNSTVTGTTRLSNAPWAGRHTFGFGNSPDAVYIFGGDLISGSYQTDSWKGVLSGDTITWSQLNSGISCFNRILFGSTYHNGYLYVIGGQVGYTLTEGVLTDVWRSSDGITWTQIATGLTQFGKNIVGGVVSYGGYIWVIGGGIYDTPTTSGTFDNQVWRSVDGITWEQMPDAPWSGRQYMDCTVHDGKVFMVGGVTGGVLPADNNGEVWSMDINGNWEQMPDGLTDRHATAVASYKNKLVASTGNYWNDTYTLSKFKASTANEENTLVVRGSNGFTNSDVFNATTGNTGGYIVGSTDLNLNGDAFWYHSTDTTLFGSYENLALFAGTGSPAPNPNIIIESNGNVRLNRITTNGLVSTIGGNGTLAIATSISGITGNSELGGNVYVGTHNGSKVLAVERYLSGFPYAVIRAGSTDQDVPVGFSFQPRDASGTEVDGLEVTSTGVKSYYDLTVPDEAFGPGFNGSLEVPTKNAVYDAFQSGTYTPTPINGVNEDGITTYACTYTKIGDVVRVSGPIDIVGITSGSTVSIEIDLPIARTGNFTTDKQAYGSGTAVPDRTCDIVSVSSSQRVKLSFLPNSGGSNWNFHFSFEYKIN